jgi:hypothetical protein
LRHVEETPFTIAVAASAVWNLIILGIFCSVLLENFGIEDALKISPKAGAMLCWIVAPSIGYFYGSLAPDRDN